MQFAHDFKDYTQNLDVVETWFANSVVAIQRATGASEETIIHELKQLPEVQKITKTKINYLKQDKRGNRKPQQKPLVKYLKEMQDSSNVITPMFTSFVSKDVKEAPQPKFIKAKMAERKAVKGAAAAADNAGDKTKSIILTGVQNAIKILINSFSGAALSAHNPFYSGSLHQVLCAMCRVSTAIATSIVERLIAGIRFYHKPSLVTDDLVLTIQKTNRTKVIMAMEDLGLRYPTRDECLAIIRRSYKDYWWEVEKEEEFLPVLDSLDEVERASFCYSMDFYHIYKMNHTVIKDMVTDITVNDMDAIDTNVPWIMKTLNDDEKFFLTGLIGEEIKGSFLKDHLKEGSPLRDKINGLAYRMKQRLLKYKTLSDAFFLTEILPIDVGNQDKAIRHAVSLGDTDSSILNCMHITKLHYGESKFTPDQNPATEFAVYLINGAIEHGLGTFTGQMNVHPDDRNRLVMKNEFGFSALFMTPYKKTYFSKVRSCEGSVYADDNPRYELKGQRFHAGKSNKDMVSELHKWMKDIPVKLERGEKISRTELLDMIIDIEKDIENGLDRKEDHKFPVLKIKPFEAYSNPKSQEWAKHNLWEWCFAGSYGSGGKEGYASYKLPLRFEGGLQKFIETTSPRVRNGIEKYLDYVTDGDVKKRSSKSIKYLPIPVDVMKLHGIPPEIKPLVDIDNATKKALDPHHLVLAAMGIVMIKKDKSSGDNLVRQKKIQDILI